MLEISPGRERADAAFHHFTAEICRHVCAESGLSAGNSRVFICLTCAIFLRDIAEMLGGCLFISSCLARFNLGMKVLSFIELILQLEHAYNDMYLSNTFSITTQVILLKSNTYEIRGGRGGG